MFSTPGGRPASEASSANASAVSGVNSAGLRITVQPAASAGAFRLEQLRPSRVMVEMARHERYVDVARLADALAVVHRFEHGEEPRISLYGARESVEVPRALVAAEFLPAG